MFKLWKLVDNKPVICDESEISESKLKEIPGTESIKRTEIGRVLISTVFIGFFEPYFETIVFGGEYNGEQRRCKTYEDAISDHQNVVYMVNKKQIDRENKLDELGIN